MARIFVFDSDPAGLAAHERANAESADLRLWMTKESIDGALIVIPAIVDYEVRRSLILNEAWDGVRRLDALYQGNLCDVICHPITEGALKKAAGLWADARRRGQQTAHDQAIDGDVIRSAQAMDCCSDLDDWQVITENVDHIARYVGDRARSRRAVVNDWLRAKRSIIS